jgi:hypothetical protein
MWELRGYPRGRRVRRSHCGIKSGIDFDKLIVEKSVGCQANLVGLAQLSLGHPGTTMA